ncbi:MAG TPA: hypothetical protein VFY93_16940 [Planctomycetota bacterium]|nr:hypothetical protein [Planctomycetota bacterium]
MKAVVWLCLLVAGVATAILVLLRMSPRDEPAPAPGPPPPPPPARVATDEDALRPYETVATLAEDLRDALAGPKEALGAEVARVSLRLRPNARRVLVETARQEPSPRVRALLVLAAGVHVPDEAILLAYLDDREPVVRRAAVLATARREGGSPVALMEGVEVPVGRELPAETRRALAERLPREEDEGVRGTIGKALG